jgi:hypothetical protein
VDVIIDATLDDNGVTWRVRGRTSQFPTVHDAPLKTALAGRELIFEDAAKVVEGQGLELRRIVVWPGWWPRFPF